LFCFISSDTLPSLFSSASDRLALLSDHDRLSPVGVFFDHGFFGLLQTIQFFVCGPFTFVFYGHQRSALKALSSTRLVLFFLYITACSAFYLLDRLFISGRETTLPECCLGPFSSSFDAISNHHQIRFVVRPLDGKDDNGPIPPDTRRVFRSPFSQGRVETTCSTCYQRPPGLHQSTVNLIHDLYSRGTARPTSLSGE
jgi:hypothetical protein